MRSILGKFYNIALVIFAVGGTAVLPGQVAAQTYTATVGETTYDFSTFTGTYDDSLATLQAQFWWGDIELATQAANALGNAAGYPNNTYWGSSSPVFVYASNMGVVYVESSATAAGFEFNNQTTYTIAQAAVAVPEINGNAISLLGFILGVIALGLRSGLRAPRQATPA